MVARAHRGNLMHRKGLALALAAGLALGGTASAQGAGEGTPLQAGQQVRGEITSSDPLNWSDGSRSERFGITLREGQAVRFAASGPLNASLSAFLDGDLLAGPTGEGNPDLVVQAPRTGQYVLAVSGRDASSFGPFTLQASEQQVYDGGQIGVGASLVDWTDSARSIPLRIEREGVYTIRMDSDVFDTALGLEGGGISLSNDDSDGGSNSMITAALVPGTYQLRTDGFMGQMGGEYRLQVSSRELPDGATVATPGVLVPGTPVTALYQGAPVDYRLAVPSRALATITMDSSEIDSTLRLQGAGVQLEDDDSGDALNARISMVLEPGEYTVQADSYSRGGGVFTLSATLSEVPSGRRGGELGAP